MKLLSISAMVATFALMACAPQPETTRSSMSIQAEVPTLGATSAGARINVGAKPESKIVLQSQYDVQQIFVDVPTSLRTSEANTFHPNVDIVWRGDVPGDRYAQVKAIFETAMARGTETMHKGPKVIVNIEVTRFHCVTEKTRYTVGGVHDMRFILTVRDAATGTILQAPRLVNADVHASGGQRAIAEDNAGLTQKVVVTNRLAEVIRRELSTPVQAPVTQDMISRYEASPAKLSFIE